MKSGEELYNKVNQSPRFTAKSRTYSEFASWTSGSFQSRSDIILVHAKRARSSKKPVARRLQAVTSTSKHEVCNTQPFKRKTIFAEKQSRDWSINLKHPNRESLVADLEKNQQFKRRVKGLIRSMGNTEYFELCQISSKIQCPDCSLFWEIGIENCTCGKCLQPSKRNRQLNKERHDVLSIPNCVIKSDPSRGARHGPTERHRIYHKAHNMLWEGQKKKCNTWLERF